MRNLQHSLQLGMLAPVYLFYGDEPLLMEEMAEQICALASPAGEEWNREVYQASEISPDDIVLSAGSGGFMGMRRVIIVRDITWLKRGKKAKDNSQSEGDVETTSGVDLESLIEYAADPNPDTVLILMVNGAVPSNSRLLKAVNKGGRAVQFAALKGMEKERWLASYLKAAAKAPERGVIPYLALMSGDGLLAAKSEADKLILYTEGKTAITMEDARDIVSGGSIAGVFDLSDRMAEKQGGEAVAVLRRLLLQGEAAQKLLAMLGTQYHNTLAVKDMLSRGYTAKEAASRLSMNPYAAQKCAAQARRYTNRQLSKALELLLNADIAQKRGEGDLSDLLEVAILRICAM